MEIVLFEPQQERLQRFMETLSVEYTLKAVADIRQFSEEISASRAAVFIFDYDALKKNKRHLQHIETLILNSPAYFVIVSTRPSGKLKGLQKNHAVVFVPPEISCHQLLTVIDILTGQVYAQVKKSLSEQEFLVKSDRMKDVLRKIKMVKDKDLLVLFTGETGTGKTALAKVLHEMSTRRNEPFVHLNCAAIPEGLLEAELFGYVHGAFTGAETDRMGKFKAAGNGTIFLDEIGEIPSPLQAKLLKVLDEKEYYPVGGTKSEKVNARILVATNKNLAREVREKKFREDLYFRINSFEIHIPPLRERPEEIEPLFDVFLAYEAKENDRAVPEISAAVYELLKSYSWPGNVRELQNLAKILIISGRKSIDVDALPPEFFDAPGARLFKSRGEILPLEQMKAEYARYVYRLNGYRKMQTAASLQVDIKTLRRLLSQ